MTMASARPASLNRDRIFYTGMSLAMIATVFAGFAPTYYLKTYTGTPALSLATHLHGAAFTAWLLLFFTQTALIAGDRADIHRKLGVVGATLAAAMVPLGIMAATFAIRAEHTPPGIDPRSFLVLPFFDIALFAIFVIVGVIKRRQPQAHKRLMLLSTIAMLDAAIARLPGLFVLGPPVFFAIQDLFLLGAIFYDYKSRGRVHPAYIWGGLLILLSQPLRLVVAGTPLWLAFGDWVKG
jgi:hypothetical protein